MIIIVTNIESLYPISFIYTSTKYNREYLREQWNNPKYLFLSLLHFGSILHLVVLVTRRWENASIHSVIHRFVLLASRYVRCTTSAQDKTGVLRTTTLYRSQICSTICTFSGRSIRRQIIQKEKSRPKNQSVWPCHRWSFCRTVLLGSKGMPVYALQTGIVVSAQLLSRMCMSSKYCIQQRGTL